jgi:fructosamine-3-kinase
MAQEMGDESIGRLLSDALRIPMEQCVSEYLEREWRVTEVEDKADEASHPAAILSDEIYSVFVKLGEGDLARDQFEKEVAGLQLLTERSGVLTPAIIGLLQVKGGALVVMQAVEEVKRERLHWRQIGQALAKVHRVKGDRFGLETHCYWGSLYQDNTPHEEWLEFFWERRIAPRLKDAVDSGHLPLDLVPEVEKLRAHLPRLCGPEVEPSLLHGDAQQNNFISTAEGPVMIDPSVYFGHPEMDLAYVDFFAPVSEELFEGYREITPIDPDFTERRDLWRLPAWLAMVQVEGPQYLDRLITALQRYI